MENLTELPQDFPTPIDDGMCHRLMGKYLPSIALASTQGESVDFGSKNTPANYYNDRQGGNGKSRRGS